MSCVCVIIVLVTHLYQLFFVPPNPPSLFFYDFFDGYEYIYMYIYIMIEDVKWIEKKKFVCVHRGSSPEILLVQVGN